MRKPGGNRHNARYFSRLLAGKGKNAYICPADGGGLSPFHILHASSSTKTDMNGTGKFFAILALAGFMAACAKDEGDIEMLPYSDSFGRHLKTLTIYDDTGENSAELLVGADHQEILDLWQADNFRLVVSKNEASVEADVEAFLQAHTPKDKKATAKAGTPKPTEPAAHITTRFLSKQLQPDVVAVNLATLPPYGDDMRGWKYETHFAYAGEDGTLTCIFRNAGSKNYGFCALDYQATPGGQWSTMIGSWYPVNGSLERSAAPCYRMRASRRYLDNTPDVTIEFVNQRL